MNNQWKLVPVEPTETMVINGFESVPNECFTDEEVWEQYQEMSGCQQAAFRAKLCWAAMIASAPAQPQAELDRVTAERDALQERLNAADQRADDLETQLGATEQSRRAWFDSSQAADRRIDELTSKQVADEQLCRGSAALGTGCGKCARCLVQPGEVKFKGMIETVCGTFAVMIDEANTHYGWTFMRHPDGMWVSGRPATDAEMQAARRHAQASQFLTGVHPYSTPL